MSLSGLRIFGPTKNHVVLTSIIFWFYSAFYCIMEKLVRYEIIHSIILVIFVCLLQHYVNYL